MKSEQVSAPRRWGMKAAFILFCSLGIIPTACVNESPGGEDSNPLLPGIQTIFSHWDPANYGGSRVFKNRHAWLLRDTVFYFDGREVQRIPADVGFMPEQIRLSGENLVIVENPFYPDEETNRPFRQKLYLQRGKFKKLLMHVELYASLGPVAVTENKILWCTRSFNGNRLFQSAGDSTIELTGFPIDLFSEMAADGDWMAWTSGPENAESDSLRNILLHDGKAVLNLHQDSSREYDLRVSSRYVAWVSGITYSQTGGPRRLMIYDGKEPRVAVENFPATNFGFHAGKAVWVANDGKDDEIFLYEDGMTRQLTDNDFMDSDPSIHEDDVVWSTMTGTDSEIMHYRKGKVTQITDNETMESEPLVSHGRIFWKTRSEIVEGHSRMTTAVP